MESKSIVKSLSQEEYARVHDTYKYITSNDEIHTELIMSQLAKLDSEPIEMMSIGPGTGSLEDIIIKSSGKKVTYILAVEINPFYREKLHQISTGWKDTTVDIDLKFDADYVTAKRFDLILMVHSIYGLGNPIDAILKARSFLKPSGQLLIVAHGNNGGYQLFSHLLRIASLTVAPISNNAITSGLISGGLKNIGIKHEIRERKIPFDVTDFIIKRDCPVTNDILSMFLQTMYANLDGHLKDEIYEVVKKFATFNEKGRFNYSEESHMIVIENIQ